MTEVLTPADPVLKDFSHQKQPIRFKIDDDEFEGPSDLPVLLLVEFGALAEQLSESSMKDQPKIFRSVFELMLTDESAAKFIARMSDKAKPISMEQINDIMPWIMEQHGMRPTQPSSDSSPGSGSLDGGTNSTESAPAEVSTSEPSAPSDS